MNKKISLGAAIAFMIVVAGITFCITMMVSLGHFNKMVLNVAAREEMYKKISNIDHKARQKFAGKIDEEELSDGICEGYVKGLGDPYSTYLSKDEYEELLAEQSGKRVSVGIETDKSETGYLTITKVYSGSPAALGGIRVNDTIISVDGKDVKPMNLKNAQRLLKGEAGTKVKFTYRRSGVDTTVELMRKDVDIPYVESRMIGKNGYIQISDFNDKTYAQFKMATDDLIQKGATGLILDVRGNNSDSIDAANDMLDILLPSGELGTIVDNAGNKKTSGYSDSYSVNLPMSVLIDEGTGCASEYFAEALKELGKASIVGRTSIGKTALQEIEPLTDGSAINLTVSHFLTPSGKDISGVGIKPDYDVKQTMDTNGKPSSAAAQDAQLNKAIEVENSKG